MFKLHSKYSPSGDQPKAIENVIENLKNNVENQVIEGVTGSGKTFTIANVISKMNRPILVLSHNKTLASQLYIELKEFFPENHVEYFVSYFDYYRPEAYIVSSDTYIDKTSKTNAELDAMRMSSYNSALTHRDTIIVASVASIYGASNPDEYRLGFMILKVGDTVDRSQFARELIKRQYERNPIELQPGQFRNKGDVYEIYPAWNVEHILRIEFEFDEIFSISLVDPINKVIVQKYKTYNLYPASAYVTSAQTLERAIKTIEVEFKEYKEQLAKENKLLALERLTTRISEDIDNLKEFGMTPGIENYSRHLDGRKEGEKPYTLLDYLPKDTILFIDESHMMIPQLHAMYKGDRSRKLNLVEHGFRLPSALDNRPLTFEEWNQFNFQKVFISATPGEYELEISNDNISKLIIRPTGLVDPIIEIESMFLFCSNLY